MCTHVRCVGVGRLDLEEEVVKAVSAVPARRRHKPARCDTSARRRVRDLH